MTTPHSHPTPHLELPENPPPPRVLRTPPFVIAMLVIIVGMQMRNAYFSTRPIPTGSSTANSEDLTALAQKLEDRNLPIAAIGVWNEYLTTANLPAPDQAKIHYRIGKLHQQADQHQPAIASFYRAESLLADSDDDLARNIARHVRESFQKLGQYADLSREIAQRTDLAQNTTVDDRQVVAQIADDKITIAEFDRMLTGQIDQLIAMQPGLSATDAATLRKRMHEQFNDPDAKAAELQQLIAHRVLATEARTKDLHQSPAYREQLADFSDRLLATRMMLDEVSRRATVTPQDIQRFYEANKSRYTGNPDVTIAHIVTQTEDEALDVIALAQSGADFADLAQRRSIDETTKDNAGLLDGNVTENSAVVPGLGPNPEAQQRILNTAVDTVVKQPVKSDKGWHVYKIIKRSDPVPPPLEDIQDQVALDTRQARQTEVTQQYLRELFETHNVRFYPNAFKTTANE